MIRKRIRIRASHSSRGEQRRELYFFTLYRVLVAALLVFLVSSPLAQQIVELRLPWLARAVAIPYLLMACALLLAARRSSAPLAPQVALGLGCDVIATLLAKASLDGPEAGLALLLIVNIGAGALLLPVRLGLGFALAASIGSLVELMASQVGSAGAAGNIAETSMFAVTYLTAAVLCHLLGKQLRESAALAQRRGEQIASLEQINELIIRRMRSGVIVVDAAQKVRLINEAAWHLIGEPSPNEQRLERMCPELARRLTEWRIRPSAESEPAVLAKDRPEVIPRITRLSAIDELFLIFLDDSRLVSRRAEELTLSTLGRLSASIAHEIRNPLAAISHAAQLLEESPALVDGDRHLLGIVLNHCRRMNGIVENVLSLSRRERSRPEQIELGAWVDHFVKEYRTGHFIEGHQLRSVTSAHRLFALVDPQQLHQVVTILVNNALIYGHAPDEPARISVVARAASEGGAPLVEVIDCGPGVSDNVLLRIFDPFFTTGEHGSGLGLYIARQLCEANQSTLEYKHHPNGGSCFRITLPRPSNLRLETSELRVLEAP